MTTQSCGKIPLSRVPQASNTRAIRRGYAVAGKRFSQEHGYRFLKQDLLWTLAHLRTPEQMERWSWIVACANNLLLLSKHLDLAIVRPWESKQRPVTPRQVRRAMPSLLQVVGTPASAPKPRGKSPGWRKGKQRTLAPRFPVVKKPKPVPKTSAKEAAWQHNRSPLSSIPTCSEQSVKSI